MLFTPREFGKVHPKERCCPLYRLAAAIAFLVSSKVVIIFFIRLSALTFSPLKIWHGSKTGYFGLHLRAKAYLGIRHILASNILEDKVVKQPV